MIRRSEKIKEGEYMNFQEMKKIIIGIMREEKELKERLEEIQDFKLKAILILADSERAKELIGDIYE